MPSDYRFEDKWPDLEGGYSQIPNLFIRNMHRLPFIGPNGPRNQAGLLQALWCYIEAAWDKNLEWRLANTEAGRRQGITRKTAGNRKTTLEKYGLIEVTSKTGMMASGNLRPLLRLMQSWQNEANEGIEEVSPSQVGCEGYRGDTHVTTIEFPPHEKPMEVTH